MVTWDEFEKVSRADWLKKADLDLKGPKRAEDLLFDTGDGIRCSPFLTNEDHIISSPIQRSVTKAGVAISGKGKMANKKALKMLSYGAEALCFEITEDVEFDILFEDIYLDMISVWLNLKENSAIIRQKLNDYTNKLYKGKSTSLFLVTNSENINESIRLTYEQSFVERFTKLKKYFSDNSSLLSFTTYVIVVDLKKDFLGQIAELRAIRKLSDQLKDLRSGSGSEVILIGVIHPDVFNGSEIHPLIATNYLILSSYLGMCDFCFGLPFDEDEESARLSLNIQHIFKEESRIGFVTDPTAGSYIIEKLTGEFLHLSD